jgi:hypothetical protein
MPHRIGYGTKRHRDDRRRHRAALRLAWVISSLLTVGSLLKLVASRDVLVWHLTGAIGFVAAIMTVVLVLAVFIARIELLVPTALLVIFVSGYVIWVLNSMPLVR